MQALNERILHARTTAGLTQEQFGRLAKLRPEHVARIESGAWVPDSLKVLGRLARACQVDLQAFLASVVIQPASSARADAGRARKGKQHRS